MGYGPGAKSRTEHRGFICGRDHYIIIVVKHTFILPSAPVLMRSPPTGEEWLHEIKHDGWRGQLHKADGAGTIYSRHGNDLSGRFRALAAAVASVPVSAIIDAEVVACDAKGMPDFRAIMAGKPRTVCAWCFDLMWLDGEDLRGLPLVDRRDRLEALLTKTGSEILRFSEAFDGAEALLAAVAELGLEGIVSKRRDQPYRSGKNTGWVKIKTAVWRESNRSRWEKFQR